MKRFLVGVVITLTVLVIVAGVFFLGVGYYLSPQSPLARADAIVAVSGGDTTARTQMAVELYKAGWSSELIFSGAAADVDGPSNARAMAEEAISEGVPASSIQLDETSDNTAQNADNVANIINSDHYHSIILVTSPYHQRRAYIEFQRALTKHFTIINHSSYDPMWRRSHWWATSYSRDLTFSELQKVAYILAAGQ
jgi:uncharacterized SAM-binding protein YcdF (DUF218 family)